MFASRLNLAENKRFGPEPSLEKPAINAGAAGTQRQALERDVAAFLANGGEVRHIPTGVGTAPVFKFDI